MGGAEPTSTVVGTEANPLGVPSSHPGTRGVGAVPSTKGTPTAGGIRVGAWVQVAGRRGRFRVVGVTAHGVELRDRDERWHVVRLERCGRPAMTWLRRGDEPHANP